MSEEQLLAQIRARIKDIGRDGPVPLAEIGFVDAFDAFAEAVDDACVSHTSEALVHALAWGFIVHAAGWGFGLSAAECEQTGNSSQTAMEATLLCDIAERSAKSTTPGDWKVNRYDNDSGSINWQVQQCDPPGEVIANIDDAEPKRARYDANFAAAAHDKRSGWAALAALTRKLIAERKAGS